MATEIIEKAKAIGRHIVDVFGVLGFRLNLKRGKTEVLFTFHGKGSVAERRKLEQDMGMQLEVSTRTGAVVHIAVTGICKHVGTYSHGAGRLAPARNQGTHLHDEDKQGAAQTTSPCQQRFASGDEIVQP